MRIERNETAKGSYDEIRDDLASIKARKVLFKCCFCVIQPERREIFIF